MGEGIWITGISIAGIIGSILALIAVNKRFARQRRELLESMEIE